MLEADSISINFGSTTILSGCYLSCEPGEIVGLLGRNGAGKSTLLKIIFGSLKADFKHLRVNGKIIRNGFENKNIGYLPQQSFIPSFYRTDEILNQISDELLTESIRFHLNKFGNTQLNNLSGGELKLLECLWVLSLPAKYILLDEPFSGISPIQIELLQKAIKIASKQKGIVLTDHLYLPLQDISTRLVLLHNNAIYSIKEKEDLVRYNYLPELENQQLNNN